MSTDILHFPARVLVNQAASVCSRVGDPDPGYLLPIYSCDLPSPAAVAARLTPVFVVVGTMVMRPLRLTGMSRTMLIG